jgi:5-methylcytosine-specific restriction endonuclease McrA
MHCQECAPEAKRRTRRVQKGRREARKRGVAYESVDPMKVFARDKWRCQLCGIKTPKSLRGTCEPNAPELDHIDPLAAGGSHTYANTQCACRRCNGAKGAKPLGQLNLPIAA